MSTSNKTTATEKLQSFAPVIPDNPNLLILGSMPGVASLQAAQYYAHPRNGFWKILQSIYTGNIDTYEQRLRLIKTQGIALWDVLKHCERPGSLDADIASQSVIANDFAGLLQDHPGIKLIAFNGKAAEKWFIKLALPTLTRDSGSGESGTGDSGTGGSGIGDSDLAFASLPSSSPAMAALTLEAKTELWRQALIGKQPPGRQPASR